MCNLPMKYCTLPVMELQSLQYKKVTIHVLYLEILPVHETTVTPKFYHGEDFENYQ